jgi:pimeloyl-ACP methyl ester carboxylesterase
VSKLTVAQEDNADNPRAGTTATRLRHWSPLVAAALATATLVVATPASAATVRRATAKPTIVLVHGAFADASSFAGVTQRLQAAGYPVLAIANPLRGIGYDSAYLASVLATIKGPIVLVGHSYAGALIGNVVDPRVKGLVYIAAFLPDVGESVSQTNAHSRDVLLGPGAQIARQYPAPGGGTGTEVYIKPGDFRRIFAADLSPARVRVLAASRRPIDLKAFSEPVTNATWHTIRSWCLVPEQDRAIGTDAELAMARRAHCHTQTIPGSHLVMVAKPDSTARFIEAAARATT